MRKDAILFGIAGVFFGVLVGWIIGAQQAPAVATPPGTQSVPAQSAAGSSQQGPPPFDESRASQLKSTADRNPSDPETRVQLGNLYFDAERYDEAARWYEAALKVDPKHSKTLLNIGIVRAFGKQDLDGAEKAWQRVIDLAPDSPEAAVAKKGLDGLRAAHGQGGSTPVGKPPGESN
jgi:Tfp pilus assembly protein PilF